MEMATHYITTPDRIDQKEVNSFNLLLQAALSAANVRTPQGKRQNLLVLLVNKVNDLPSLAVPGQSPSARSITLEDARPRGAACGLLCGSRVAASFFDSGGVPDGDALLSRSIPEDLRKRREESAFWG